MGFVIGDRVVWQKSEPGNVLRLRKDKADVEIITVELDDRDDDGRRIIIARPWELEYEHNSQTK
jgi:hypothetical protein